MRLKERDSLLIDTDTETSGEEGEVEGYRERVERERLARAERRRKRGIVGTMKKMAAYIAEQFWRPVRLFGPHKVEVGNGKIRWDWNLTLVGITLFIYVLSIVSLFLYACFV